MAQPFFLVSSSKVAEFWFSEHQRTLANALSFIANPLGVVFGSIAPMIFVSNSNSTHHSTDILILVNSIFQIALKTPTTSFLKHQKNSFCFVELGLGRFGSYCFGDKFGCPTCKAAKSSQCFK